MHTVLLIEPHRATRELLTAALSQAGYKVLALDDDADAVEQFSLSAPDIVVVAVDAPRVRGRHPGALIRASGAGQEIPLVAVDRAHLGKARGVSAVLDLRPDAYFADPTKRADLIARLAQLVAAASARRAPSGTRVAVDRPAVDKGNLGDLELPVHYLALVRTGRDGVIVVRRGDLERRIYLLGGRPVNFESAARQDSFGRHLVDTGVIGEHLYEQHLARMRDGLSASAALVAVGALPPGDEMVQRLKEFVRARVADTLGMTEGRFEFFSGDKFRANVQILEMSSLGPILDGTRRHWPVRHFVKALKPQMTRYPCRTAAFARDLSELGLGTADLKLALKIAGSQTLKELAEDTNLKEALALVWFLALVGSVEFSAAPAESATPAFAALQGVPRRRRKPLDAETARLLREEAVRLLTASYFGVLGLDIAADAEAVERAYNEQARKFHPDAYAEFDVESLADLFASVQDRVGAAYRVLSDASKRASYLAHVLGQREVSRVERINVEAEVELKRGETALRRKDLSGAIAHFERAVALNPREPEYYSYLAWATFKGLPASKQGRAKAALRLCRKALQANPTLDRPQVIAALVHHEMGDTAEARKILLKVLRENPACELAKRSLQAVNRVATPGA